MMTRCACISDAANMLLHYIITHYSMLSFIISDKSMTIDNIIILYMSHIILRAKRGFMSDLAETLPGQRNNPVYGNFSVTGCFETNGSWR